MVVLFGDHLGHQIDYSIGLSSADIGLECLLPTPPTEFLSVLEEECFLVILLSWRGRFMFLLISLQSPDSLNVLRGEMGSSTAGRQTAGPALSPLPSVLMKIFPFIEFPRVRGCEPKMDFLLLIIHLQ